MMEIDIDVSIQKILEKYHLQDSCAEKRRQMYRIVKKTLSKINFENTHIAIRCAGNHTYFLLMEFKDILKVDYLIDQKPADIMPDILNLGIPIYTNVLDTADTIIISSFDYRSEIKQELSSVGCERVIDLYDVLEQNGYNLQCEFYNYFREPYKLLIDLKQQYLKEKDRNVKDGLLLRLVKEFLGIRDFVSAFDWIQEYCNERFSKVEEIENLKIELISFLNDLKRRMNDKDNSNIIWFWQDGLPQYIVDQMPFLVSMKKRGVYFNQSYSHNSVTRSVYGNILDKTMEVDRHKGKYKEKNHLFTTYLQENGYHVFKVQEIEKNSIDLNNYDYNRSRKLIINNIATTELYWSALRLLLLSNEKMVLLLHTGMETHIPVMAPTLEQYYNHGAEYLAERFDDIGRNKYLQVLKKTSRYVDQELQFFTGILGESVIKIYMSDHGDILSKESYVFTRDSMQTVLAVESSKLKPKQFDKLFPLSNFLELFKYILDPNEENEKNMFVEDMRITGVDFYDLKLIQQLIKMDFAKFGIAYDGYLTTDDRYVVLATGEEIYSTIDQDLVNGIDFPQNQPRVHKWRERITADGYNFLHNKDFPKFANSKYLYEALGKKRMWD